MIAKLKAWALSLWEKVKAFLKWVYDWITVLTASLVGIPDLVLQLLSSLDGVDYTPFVAPTTAAKIVTIVAVLKGLLAFIISKMKKPA